MPGSAFHRHFKESEGEMIERGCGELIDMFTQEQHTHAHTMMIHKHMLVGGTLNGQKCLDTVKSETTE